MGDVQDFITVGITRKNSRKSSWLILT